MVRKWRGLGVYLLYTALRGFHHVAPLNHVRLGGGVVGIEFRLVPWPLFAEDATVVVSKCGCTQTAPRGHDEY